MKLTLKNIKPTSHRQFLLNKCSGVSKVWEFAGTSHKSVRTFKWNPTSQAKHWSTCRTLDTGPHNPPKSWSQYLEVHLVAGLAANICQPRTHNKQNSTAKHSEAKLDHKPYGLDLELSWWSVHLAKESVHSHHFPSVHPLHWPIHSHCMDLHGQF